MRHLLFFVFFAIFLQGSLSARLKQTNVTFPNVTSVNVTVAGDDADNEDNDDGEGMPA